jgi:hypothetical protein
MSMISSGMPAPREGAFCPILYLDVDDDILLNQCNTYNHFWITTSKKWSVRKSGPYESP